MTKRRSPSRRALRPVAAACDVEPRAIDRPDPPVDIAAVNPWMLQMAGEVADGIHVHPLHSSTYLVETLVPNLNTGAERAGRDPSQARCSCRC
ncbi:MAG: LLM class flavin-dependent oxidoreductase [Microthrixaceae bacterium]|nr:LLM class flavin-dependent oxidoreductase [Microthrixaceae bacterium]